MKKYVYIKNMGCHHIVFIRAKCLVQRVLLVLESTVTGTGVAVLGINAGKCNYWNIYECIRPNLVVTNGSC